MSARPTSKSASTSAGAPSAAASISAARREAFAILLTVEGEKAHSDDLLRGRRVSALSAQDRHLCTTLVLGTLRWQLQLDALIRPLLSRPNAKLDAEVRVALRLGAFQLQHLDRIPAHAAINESVALTRAAGHPFATGMVNAVLRKVASLPKPQTLDAESLSKLGDAKTLAEATAHPLWLVERWIANFGFKAAARIGLHGQNRPELTLRLDRAEAEAELTAQGIELAPGAVLMQARRVASGDLHAAIAAGLDARMQEEGSQLVAELAGFGTCILDCCAAPGGKTLILAERNPAAQIAAGELSAARAQALRQRIALSRYAAQIEVVERDATLPPLNPLDAGYDLVLADVPCSGTGTLGRNPEIRHRLQPDDLVRHHQRQCAILRAALQASTSRVLYSTCSLEPEENASVVSEVLADSPDWRQVSLQDQVRELAAEGQLTAEGAVALLQMIAEDGSVTLLPGSLGAEHSADHFTDGFFIAALKKRPS